MKIEQLLEECFIVLTFPAAHVSVETRELLQQVGPTYKDKKLKEDVYNIEDIIEDEMYTETNNSDTIALDISRIQEKCKKYHAAYFRLEY